jgi:very-short-patch-repair endonuclease
MADRGEFLVAIMNNASDFSILKEKLWYRIPVRSKAKWLKDKWPPQWLAFYQTKEFAQEAYGVNYFGRVLDIVEVYRWQLFPNDPEDEKSLQKYFKIRLLSLERLPQPILSRRRRRIVFIPTTRQRFIEARELNDLYLESSLEEKIWDTFKLWMIPAERQEFITANRHDYSLDFAIYCAKGNIAIEADGDFWHANPEKAEEDNIRDTDLKISGWEIFHFSSHQIEEKMEEYCLPSVAKKINALGGVDEGKKIPRKIDLKVPPGSYQPLLFDE